MRSKVGVALVATAAGGLAMIGPSATSAATITGGGTSSATAGASRRVITKTTGNIPLNCTTSGFSVSVSSGTYTTFPSVIGAVTPTFTTCVGPSGLVYTYACAPKNLSITGSPVAGRTPVAIAMDCDISFTAGSTCKFKVAGSINASYTNPGVTPPSPNPHGAITVFVDGQNLAVASTNGVCGAIVAVGDRVDFGGPGGGALGLTDLIYRLATTGPVVS